MAKLVSKSELEFQNGYVIYNGEVINFDIDIVDYLNFMETKIQVAKFEKKNTDSYVKEEVFHRTSNFDPKINVFKELNTPTLDAKIEESIKLMQDMDEFTKHDKINELIHIDKTYFNWLDADKVCIITDGKPSNLFDLPTLGNPLKLTSKKLIKAIKKLM